MNPVKRALKASDDYAKQSTWMDFALIKTCLCALGVMIGISVPKESRKPVLGVAAVTYAVTYVAIMSKFLPVLKEHMERD
ncbi:MAG: permease of phosphate ABC transporter [Clostridia bacterium]|nr:permease of phosphate ABC transporter [Clostridia bacterium]